MDEVVEALAAQQEELTGLVEDLDDEGLAQPSRCEGWTVADVLLHLAQTNEMAVGSVAGRLAEVAIAMSEGIALDGTVDDWAGAVVDRERGAPLAEVRARWAASAAAQEAAFRSCDPHARVQWVAGDMAATTLATTRLTETWIHTVDIAAGCGVELPPTDRLWHTARLIWRTLPYALAGGGRESSGPVTFDLVAPDGSNWTFEADGGAAPTVITGPAAELCEVAAQRASAADTTLTGTGPDAEAVLALMRTFA